jgi:hypothetical protein
MPPTFSFTIPSFTGRLLDPSGNPVTGNVEFRLYNLETGGLIVTTNQTTQVGTGTGVYKSPPQTDPNAGWKTRYLFEFIDSDNSETEPAVGIWELSYEPGELIKRSRLWYLTRSTPYTPTNENRYVPIGAPGFIEVQLALPDVGFETPIEHFWIELYYRNQYDDRPSMEQYYGTSAPTLTDFDAMPDESWS